MLRECLHPKTVTCRLGLPVSAKQVNPQEKLMDKFCPHFTTLTSQRCVFQQTHHGAYTGLLMHALPLIYGRLLDHRC